MLFTNSNKRKLMIARIGLVIVFVLGSLAAYLYAGFYGHLGELPVPGEVAPLTRPVTWDSQNAQSQFDAASEIGTSPEGQILFGDLHVHTTYSMDALLTSLPIMQGEGVHPPADACDFARYCSALDFYSINDHAEGLTPAMWSEIKESVRQCNEVAGSETAPDLVAFLGWEWTQMGLTPETHYGHKNVILKDTADELVPTRPIASMGNALNAMRSSRANTPLLALALRDFPARKPYYDFLALRGELMGSELCPTDVPVRDLPLDCIEAVETPRELFAKLDDWGFPSIVIPHGNAWGNTTPALIEWEKQLANGNHDPNRQTLIEVYSGHGNSEAYRPWRHVAEGGEGSHRCPPVSDHFIPECQRAGRIIESRCSDAGFPASECAERAETARQNFVDAAAMGRLTVPGETAEDWLASGQCTDCFEPAFLYRPGGSAQNALAVSGVDVPNAPQDTKHRFRFGFIASSDNHTARPSTGYKEFRVLGMTDANSAEASRELRELVFKELPKAPESVPIDAADIPLVPGGDDRMLSFFYTGGLVAVHAEGRNRDAIWNALEAKQVYGTSGPRMLLWFDLLNAPDGTEKPMGSDVVMSEAPRFRVRAVGSREQLPGCPEFSGSTLGADRLAALCMGECYNPSDTRRTIEKIEVVRVRPRHSRAEDVADLIDDPWLSFDCAPEQAGCSVEFEDLDHAVGGRDSVYYVRAVEQATPHVNADNLRCETDASGVCVSTKPCRPGSGSDKCLAPIGARAWSSPIFVDQG
jgi:hypothetical protein